MGSYTGLFLNLQLKHETPDPMVKIITWLVGENLDVDAEMAQQDEVFELLDHPLSATARWSLLMRGGSSDLDMLPQRRSTFSKDAKGYSLIVQSSLKNVDEIRNFFDWIGPFVSGEPGTQVGATIEFEESRLGAVVLGHDSLIWKVSDDESTCDYDSLVRTIVRGLTFGFPEATG